MPLTPFFARITAELTPLVPQLRMNIGLSHIETGRWLLKAANSLSIQ